MALPSPLFLVLPSDFVAKVQKEAERFVAVPGMLATVDFSFPLFFFLF